MPSVKVGRLLLVTVRRKEDAVQRTRNAMVHARRMCARRIAGNLEKDEVGCRVERMCLQSVELLKETCKKKHFC